MNDMYSSLLPNLDTKGSQSEFPSFESGPISIPTTATAIQELLSHQSPLPKAKTLPFSGAKVTRMECSLYRLTLKGPCIKSDLKAWWCTGDPQITLGPGLSGAFEVIGHRKSSALLEFPILKVQTPSSTGQSARGSCQFPFLFISV